MTLSELICFRCNSSELKLFLEKEENSIFECQNCQRRYCRKGSLALYDAWPCPIGIALYPVIFEENPTCKALQNAELFMAEQSSTNLELIIEDIEQELSVPRQQVRNILDCVASEAELRNYLKHLSEHLKVLGRL